MSEKFAGKVTDMRARLMVTIRSSSGCRSTSSTCGPNSGSSSRNRTPRWHKVLNNTRLPQEGKMRAAIYLRISDDPSGTQTATERQLEDCRSYADRNGWAVAEVFQDVDLSAYHANVERPAFRRMLEAMRRGEIDVVLAWKIDRLARRVWDHGELYRAAHDANVRIVTLADGIDTASMGGRLVASVMVTMAEAESESISKRVARKHEEMAKAGRSFQGGHRAFGYTKRREDLVPAEAAAIREAVDRVLAGDSLRAICRDWNDAGIATTTGGKWQMSPLKRMLTAAMLSGQREHRGEIVAVGQWPAIITPEETEALRSILRDGRRRTSYTNARSYLLSGYVQCGRCGLRMVARPRVDGVRRYVCPTSVEGTNCGRMAILAEPLEEMVVELLLRALDSPAMAAALAEQHTDMKAALAVIRDAEAQLEQLAADFYADQLITRSEFLSAREVLSDRIAGARKAMATNVVSEAVSAAQTLRQRWSGAGFEWRRRLVGAIIERVEIGPAVRGRNTFDDSRVKPVWRY